MRSRTWTFQRTNYWTPKIQSKMAEIPHLENRHDVIFFCWGWSDLDKISQTAVIWSKSKPDVEFQYWIWQTFGRIPWHVIPQPHATLQGAATWWNQCHDRATLHPPYWKSFFAILYFICFCFLMPFDLFLTSGGFRIVSNTLVSYANYLTQYCIIDRCCYKMYWGRSLNKVVK